MMRDEASAELGPPTSRIYGSIDGSSPSIIYCSIGDEPEDTVNVPVLGATYQFGEKLLELIVLSQSVSDYTLYSCLSLSSSPCVVIVCSHCN